MNPQTIELRLAQLERSGRRWRLAAVGGLTALLAVSLIACMKDPLSQPPAHIIAKTLTIVDGDGATIARLAPATDGLRGQLSLMSTCHPGLRRKHGDFGVDLSSGSVGKLLIQTANATRLPDSGHVVIDPGLLCASIKVVDGPDALFHDCGKVTITTGPPAVRVHDHKGRQRVVMGVSTREDSNQGFFALLNAKAEDVVSWLKK